MSRKARLALVLAAVAVALIPFRGVIRERTSYLIGVCEARWDTAHDRYVVQGYGLPGDSHSRYVELALKRYGVRIVNLGCIASEADLARVEGYNSVSERAVTRKFGRDVLAECYAEAKAQARPPL
jgi:hypothetical protein